MLDIAALYASFIMSYQQIHSLSACLNILPILEFVKALLSDGGCFFLGGLEYNDRIDGASTPSGRPAVTPLGDEDMRYMFTDDALPVTPAFLKNQLRYEKQRAQVVYT